MGADRRREESERVNLSYQRVLLLSSFEDNLAQMPEIRLALKLGTVKYAARSSESLWSIK